MSKTSSPGKRRTLTVADPGVVIETNAGGKSTILISSGEAVLLLEVDEKTALDAIKAFRITQSVTP